MEDSVFDYPHGAESELDVSTIINSFHSCLENQIGLDIEFDRVVAATKRTLLFNQVEFPEHVAKLILAYERTRHV